MRSKEKLPTVQINSGHSNKQTNPSKLIPCLQVAWKLAKHRCNAASHRHQEEFHTPHYLKVLHATAPTRTDLPFLYVSLVLLSIFQIYPTPSSPARAVSLFLSHCPHHPCPTLLDFKGSCAQLR